MATYLTLAAQQHLREDRYLKIAVERYLDLKPEGIDAAITRNSKALTTWYVVEEIAKSMRKEPKEILEVK